MNKNQNTQLESNFRTLEGLKSDLRGVRRNPPASQGAGYAESEKSLLNLFGKSVHRYELDCVSELHVAKPATEVIQ